MEAPRSEADFITWKFSQAAREVVQNIVSHVIDFKIFYYRCDDVENGLINYYLLLI